MLRLCRCAAVDHALSCVWSPPLILSVRNSSLTLSMSLMLDVITCHCPFGCNMVVWRLTAVALACSLLLVDALVLYGKRDPRTLTFSRSLSEEQDGQFRPKRATRSLKSNFVACRIPLTPKEHSVLESNTYEVREFHCSVTEPQSVLFSMPIILNY